MQRVRDHALVLYWKDDPLPVVLQARHLKTFQALGEKVSGSRTQNALTLVREVGERVRFFEELPRALVLNKALLTAMDPAGGVKSNEKAAFLVARLRYQRWCSEGAPAGTRRLDAAGQPGEAPGSAPKEPRAARPSASQFARPDRPQRKRKPKATFRFWPFN